MARTRIPLDSNWLAEQRRLEVLASAVAELDLDLRTVNGLEEVGVVYVKELVRLSRSELKKIPNFGEKSVQRIIGVLGDYGLTISQKPDQRRAIG